MPQPAARVEAGVGGVMAAALALALIELIVVAQMVALYTAWRSPT